MHNSYLFKKETMAKHNINLGSTILGRFGAFILVGLTILSLAGCGGGGGSSNSGSTMQIRPPSGDDLVISSLRINPPRSAFQEGDSFTLSVVVRNQSNVRTPQATVYYLLRSASDQRGVILAPRDSVPSLDPSETSLQSLNRATPASGPGTYYFQACVGLSTNQIYDCSDELRVTVSSGSGGGGSGGGGSGGGGSGGGSGPVTAVWPCPFGSGAVLTIAPRQVAPDAEIRFQGNTCGNFWVSGAGLGSPWYQEVDVGNVTFRDDRDEGQLGIAFHNWNTSGQTIIRQYTAYFCSKSDVSHSGFCGRGRERGTGTFTVRWLSG